MVRGIAQDVEGEHMTSRWKIAGGLVAAAFVTAVVIGTATGGGKPGLASSSATWTTVLKSTVGIEGLTGDGDGNLYVAARGGAAGCPVWRVDSAGPANQAPVTVGTVSPPCSP